MTDEFTDQSGRSEPAGEPLTLVFDAEYLEDPLEMSGVRWDINLEPTWKSGDFGMEKSLSIRGKVNDRAANALSNIHERNLVLQMTAPVELPTMGVYSFLVDDAGHGDTWVDVQMSEF